MSAYNEYIGILRSYNIEGEFAEVLANLLAYYSENYLADVAAQYYNSSLLKATNEDSLMQLAMDHAVSLYRGSNYAITLPVILSNNGTIPSLYFQPLQEVFSYGNHFFYFGGEQPINIIPEDNSVTYLKLIYTNKAKKVLNLELSNTKNEMFVLDSDGIISEHLAFYMIQTIRDVDYIRYIPYTSKPYFYWGVHINSLQDLENIENNEELSSLLKPLLVITTPRWGLQIKMAEYFYIKYVKNQGSLKFRLEYLNWTSNIPTVEILNKLAETLQDKFALVVIDNNFLDYSAPLPPQDPSKAIEKIQLSSRFNGIIRSIIDYSAFLNDILEGYIKDARIFYTIENQNNSGALMKYYLLYIAQENIIGGGTQIDSSEVAARINENIRKYFMLNLPHIEVNDNFLAIDPLEITLIEAYPVLLRLEISIRSADVNIAKKSLENYLSGLKDKLIDVVPVEQIFAFLNKIPVVDAVLIFRVYKKIINEYIMPLVLVYTNEPHHAQEIDLNSKKLINIEGYRQALENNMAPDIISNYFQYIKDIEIVIL